MLAFRSEAHVDAWCEQRGLERGAVFPLETCWRLAQAWYADRLRSAGVPVSYHCYPGAVHGSLALTGTWGPARTWQDDLLRSLREAHFPSNH